MQYINYILIVVGAFIAFYATQDKPNKTMLLVVGLMLLIIGVYRISKTIKDKPKEDEIENNNPDHD